MPSRISLEMALKIISTRNTHPARELMEEMGVEIETIRKVRRGESRVAREAFKALGLTPQIYRQDEGGTK